MWSSARSARIPAAREAASTSLARLCSGVSSATAGNCVGELQQVTGLWNVRRPPETFVALREAAASSLARVCSKVSSAMAGSCVGELQQVTGCVYVTRT